MKNKFKIIIPSYNNEKWIEYNIASILNQTYENYEVLYIDDNSSDNTNKLVFDMVGKNPNWYIIRNENNMRRGFNISPYNNHIQTFFKDNEDILVFIDGDDWLYDDDVLKNLNNFYNNKDCWMTYGGMVCYPSNLIAHPQNTHYSNEIHKNNAYRKDYWRASHLRTFKWHLYKKIKLESMIYSKTGKYYFHAEDLATSFPCLEMCPKDKIGVVDFYTYVFNETPINRQRGIAREAEAGVDLENEIRNEKPYEIIQNEKIILSYLGGGLGNMLFMVAAATGLSKKYGHKQYFLDNHYGILHGTPMSYKNTIFRNIPLFNNDVSKFIEVKEKSFHYTPIEVPNENVIINGHFQSQKYFDHCKDEVQELFSCPDDIKNNLLTKYNLENTVSIHIRRGNYVQLAHNHYNLSLDYYRKSIDYFKGYNILIFSDDIRWCKDNFKGNKYTFIEDQNDIEDLYLMSLCSHNVIANSTFSWWGAFLNKNLNKIVIYPDKWFGPGNKDLKISDLVPDNWICLTDYFENNNIDKNLK